MRCICVALAIPFAMTSSARWSLLPRGYEAPLEHPAAMSITSRVHCCMCLSLLSSGMLALWAANSYTVRAAAREAANLKG